MRASSYIDNLIQTAGQKYGVDPDLLRAVGMQESGLNPDIQDSEQGAQGIMQIMPATARNYGIDATDPAQAIDAAARNLVEGLQSKGSPEGAVRYYHGGPDEGKWGPK